MPASSSAVDNFLNGIVQRLYARAQASSPPDADQGMKVVDDPVHVDRILKSPDQFRKNYSLLSILGSSRFTANGSELIFQVLTAAPTPPEALAPGIDPRLSRAALRALEKRPADRFPSMAALVAALAEVVGDSSPLKVKGVVLRNLKTGEMTERPTDGVFIAIGHTPASELVAGQIEMKHSGYIKTAPFSTTTSVTGVFAAGDVTDDVYRQAVTAAGTTMKLNSVKRCRETIAA